MALRKKRPSRLSPHELRSPDGKYAAYTRDNNLFVRVIASGEEIALTSDGEEIEALFPYGHFRALEKRGMAVAAVSPWDIEKGSCHAVLIDRDAGVIHGVADPRRLGMAKGY